MIILPRGKISKSIIIDIIKILREETSQMTPSMVSVLISKFGKDPFLILISCLLSLRTRDTVTLPICIKLFSIAKTPQDLLQIPISDLEKFFYKLGFFRQKSKLIHSISQQIIEKFNGNVPKNEDDLLSLKGVGRKTANLVLAEAFEIPAIYVDTHVHKISNRLGIVKTKNTLETEMELRRIIPKEYWIEWSRLLVIWGQNVSVPAYDISKCNFSEFCKKINKNKRKRASIKW